MQIALPAVPGPVPGDKKHKNIFCINNILYIFVA
jgi:hypothetical protein